MSETVTLYSLRERILPAAAPELESCSILDHVKKGTFLLWNVGVG